MSIECTFKLLKRGVEVQDLLSEGCVVETRKGSRNRGEIREYGRWGSFCKG
jgi:hypothetical protein